jgi:hypothetical protein
MTTNKIHNDEVNYHLESLLRRVVALGDEIGVSGVDLLEEASHVLGGDAIELVEGAENRARRVTDLLSPHTTPELDELDLIFELIDLADESDLYND